MYSERGLTLLADEFPNGITLSSHAPPLQRFRSPELVPPFAPPVFYPFTLLLRQGSNERDS
jgi:hypothetical protein